MKIDIPPKIALSRLSQSAQINDACQYRIERVEGWNGSNWICILFSPFNWSSLTARATLRWTTFLNIVTSTPTFSKSRFGDSIRQRQLLCFNPRKNEGSQISGNWSVWNNKFAHIGNICPSWSPESSFLIKHLIISYRSKYVGKKSDLLMRKSWACLSFSAFPNVYYCYGYNSLR